MTTFEIADSFDATEGFRPVDLDAPLPLGYAEAVKRALELRALGTAWSYTVIAGVIGAYHGFHRSAEWWCCELRARGAEARPRGAPYRSAAA